MNANVTITLVLVCVCVSVTWSAKVVPIPSGFCVDRFNECKDSVSLKNKPAIMMRLCVFKLAKCSIPIFMRKLGLTEEFIDLKGLIKNGYKDMLDRFGISK